jgi:DNA-binding GntR family transcriptional regulator
MAERQEAAGSRSLDTYNQLRELIVRGRLAPGSRLLETEVAARLNVSRTPVRYALSRLRQEGLVLSLRGGKRGTTEVAPLTKKDGRELWFITGQLEGLAGRWCAGLADEVRFNVSRQLATLNALLEDTAGADNIDRRRLFEIDDEFHETFVKAGAGPRLRLLHQAVKSQTERYLRFYVGALSHDITAGLSEHEAIIEALRQGNADRAERAVRNNWRSGADRLAVVIDQAGELGDWGGLARHLAEPE